MTKTEYMNQLSKKLKKLPRDAYQEAMEYFEEYFAEAENEETAIKNLGSPQEAADQIITNLAIQNVDEDDGNKSVKKSFSAIWIGVLAVFAAPIGLPLALALVIVIFAFVIVVAAFAFSIIVTAISFVGSAVVGIAGSIYLLFTSPVNGIATLGLSLVALGLGILVTCGCIVVCRWIFRGIMILFGKVAKRGKKHEK
ncbi:MAG: DUF1700 domain-containing protein [Hespellia sp.]|jgi:uncharacterized membrane protein|nr:DUF1700 domain-containing protein [Hespellia sp.]